MHCGASRENVGANSCKVLASCSVAVKHGALRSETGVCIELLGPDQYTILLFFIIGATFLIFFSFNFTSRLILVPRRRR